MLWRVWVKVSYCVQLVHDQLASLSFYIGDGLFRPCFRPTPFLLDTFGSTYFNIYKLNNQWDVLEPESR
jgi:hypothetical protein